MKPMPNIVSPDEPAADESMSKPVALDTAVLERIKQHNLVVATGADHPDLQEVLRKQLLVLAFTLETKAGASAEVQFSGALAALAELRPRDGLEGMLGVQLVSVHAAAMADLDAAMDPSNGDEKREMHHRRAMRSLAMFLRQLEALDRRRGKGVVTVNVENVNVGLGAPAGVAAIEGPELPPVPALEGRPTALAAPLEPVRSLPAGRSARRAPARVASHRKVASGE